MLFQTTRGYVWIGPHTAPVVNCISLRSKEISMETEASKNSYDKVLHEFLLLMYDNDASFWAAYLHDLVWLIRKEKNHVGLLLEVLKPFSLLMTRGNKLFKRSAFNLTYLLSFPLSFVNRTHSSHCVSIIYIHYLRLFRQDCLFYHLLLACGFNETFTLVALILCIFLTKKIIKNVILFQSCGRS